ncbi:MAG: hypothetical protein L6R39_005101 [Caloplaca ligustica]|nr:MAG: hypothetical protein L6R39_005101 [Caloplaca ligustica]
MSFSVVYQRLWPLYLRAPLEAFCREILGPSIFHKAALFEEVRRLLAMWTTLGAVMEMKDFRLQAGDACWGRSYEQVEVEGRALLEYERRSKADPAPAEHISKTSKQPKQPKQPKSAKQKRKPRYDKESNTWNKTRATPIEQAGLDHQDHDLLIAMPARHADPSTYDNDMKIQIITPGGPLSYTFTTDCPQMLSLDLRFPSTLARDIASYRLKTNYVTVDEGPCFELNLQKGHQE